jgi:histone demethylase JARID1
LLLALTAGFHTYCLNPPLSFVPANEEWYCGPCIFAQGDGYGFDEGEDHSIPSFQARDNAFAKHWWTKHPMQSPASEITRTFGDSIVSEDDVEREFWRLTEDPNDTVEIEYGADVHSTTHGR